MEGEIKHLASILLWVVSSLSYCYFISSRLPKGMFRLISIVPFFYLFTILPLTLSYVITSFATTFFISWLANFKLLLFSLGKGPLSTGPKKSLPLFIAIGAFPIVIKKYSNDTSHQKNTKKFNSLKKMLSKFGLHALLLAIFVSLWGNYEERVHPKVMQLLFVGPFYLTLDVVISSTHLVVRALSGLELEPPSEEPYLSTSIQNFWGKRWNIAASNTLRITVFQPTRVATSSLLGKNQATYLAYLATFFVSGLMHELIIYNLTRQATTWEMTSYFVLHGACIIIELIAKRRLVDKYWLSPFVSRVFTIAFVLGTGSWLFIPPFSRHGLDVRFMKEIESVLQSVKAMFHVI